MTTGRPEDPAETARWEAQKAVDRVRHLHRDRRIETTDGMLYATGFCAHDDEVWPCPTIQALDGPDETPPDAAVWIDISGHLAAPGVDGQPDHAWIQLNNDDGQFAPGGPAEPREYRVGENGPEWILPVKEPHADITKTGRWTYEIVIRWTFVVTHTVWAWSEQQARRRARKLLARYIAERQPKPTTIITAADLEAPR